MIKYRLLLVAISCLLLFNTGCGLDTFYVIDSPVYNIHTPEYRKRTQDEQYFEFWTNENTHIEGFNFQGTEVYYKIYSSSSQMTSEVSALQTLSNDADKSATAADKMKNDTSSGGYGYKTLKVRNNQVVPLIPAVGEAQRVYIRLSDYQNVEDYSAKILVNDKYLNGSSSKTIPVRNTPDRRTFNFGRNGSLDLVPTDKEDDVRMSSSNSSTEWYVAMFAVGVGIDATYLVYNSNILYLGSVTIDSSLFDN